MSIHLSVFCVHFIYYPSIKTFPGSSSCRWVEAIWLLLIISLIISSVFSINWQACQGCAGSKCDCRGVKGDKVSDWHTHTDTESLSHTHTHHHLAQFPCLLFLGWTWFSRSDWTTWSSRIPWTWGAHWPQRGEGGRSLLFFYTV